MNYQGYKEQRAADFQRTNYVSHIPKGPITRREAKSYIKNFEALFSELLDTKTSQGLPADSQIKLRMRKSFKDYTVELSGNRKSGKIIMRSGFTGYTEYRFTPRSIHVYSSGQENSYGQEAAIYLHRQLPQHSYGFGDRAQLKQLASGQ